MNNEDFVTYEQAKLLNKIGFGEETRCGYYKLPNGYTRLAKWEVCEESSWSYVSLEFYKAPTLYQAQKWLRDVQNIHIEIKYTSNPQYEPWIGKVVIMENYPEPNTIINTDTCDTYEEALSEGINKAIELVKNKEQRNKHRDEKI